MSSDLSAIGLAKAEALSKVERAKEDITLSMRATKVANTHGNSPRP